MIYATLAVTVDLLWGFTGILTFGQAAFFGVGAYATAMTMTSLSGSTPAWMAAALALAIVVPMALAQARRRLALLLPRFDAALRFGDLARISDRRVTQLVYSGGLLTGSVAALVGATTLCRSISRGSSG